MRSIVISVAVIACGRPPPEDPIKPFTCGLESGIGDVSPATTICDEDPGGVCGGGECQQRLHVCLVTARRNKTPVVLRWTNNMDDGIGTQQAIVGRSDSEHLALHWLELTMVSGHDPNSEVMGKTHVRVTERACGDIVPAPDMKEDKHIQLRCISPGAERTVCTESE